MKLSYSEKLKIIKDKLEQIGKEKLSGLTPSFMFSVIELEPSRVNRFIKLNTRDQILSELDDYLEEEKENITICQSLDVEEVLMKSEKKTTPSTVVPAVLSTYNTVNKNVTYQDFKETDNFGAIWAEWPKNNYTEKRARAIASWSNALKVFSEDEIFIAANAYIDEFNDPGSKILYPMFLSTFLDEHLETYISKGKNKPNEIVKALFDESWNNYPDYPSKEQDYKKGLTFWLRFIPPHERWFFLAACREYNSQKVDEEEENPFVLPFTSFFVKWKDIAIQGDHWGFSLAFNDVFFDVMYEIFEKYKRPSQNSFTSAFGSVYWVIRDNQIPDLPKEECMEWVLKFFLRKIYYLPDPPFNVEEFSAWVLLEATDRWLRDRNIKVPHSEICEAVGLRWKLPDEPHNEIPNKQYTWTPPEDPPKVEPIIDPHMNDDLLPWPEQEAEEYLNNLEIDPGLDYSKIELFGQLAIDVENDFGTTPEERMKEYEEVYFEETGKRMKDPDEYVSPNSENGDIHPRMQRYYFGDLNDIEEDSLENT